MSEEKVNRENEFGLFPSTFEWEEGAGFDDERKSAQRQGPVDGDSITLDTYQFVEELDQAKTNAHDASSAAAPVDGVDARLFDVGLSRSSHSPAGRSIPGISVEPTRRDPHILKFQGSQARTRVEYVKQCLDDALLLWWDGNALPPRALVRDGLLVVKAGHTLSESQLTLLARASLVYGKGMLTALWTQTDPGRAALIIMEALLDPLHPMALSRLYYLVEEDAGSVQWLPELLDELHVESIVARGARQERAAVAYDFLHKRVYPQDAAARSNILLADGSGEHNEGRLNVLMTHLSSVSWLVVVGAVLVVVILAGWWLESMREADMVQVPPGTYVVHDASNAGEMRVALLSGYAIDRTEVTNRQYRRCYEQGACPWPAAVASRTRSDYFVDPGYDEFPVVNVSWRAADQYCAWRGQRLPTEEEWEVAASAAIGTGLRFKYPWGDAFNARVANSGSSDVGDTVRVGNYRPAGDSPLGASDMGGNVAEWTGSRDPYEPEKYAVKGGSFQDAAAGLAATARMIFVESYTADWIGFRCASQ